MPFGSFTTSPVVVLQLQPRPQIDALGRLLVIDDDFRGQAGHFVHPLDQRDALDQVEIFHLAGALGDDRQGVWIPLRQFLAAHDLRPIIRPAAARRTARGTARAHGRVSSASTISQLRDITTGTSWLFCTTLRFFTRRDAFVRRLHGGLLGATLRRATDMEGAHGQLRARLADRLRRDHAHRLADD